MFVGYEVIDRIEREQSAEMPARCMSLILVAARRIGEWRVDEYIVGKLEHPL